MKGLIWVCVMALLLGGCTSSTEFGPCVGAFDDKDPELVYKLSANNVFWGAMGFQFFLIPPIVVAADATFCPVGRKQKKGVVGETL